MLKYITILCLFSLLLPLSGMAKSFSTIRDDEIERYLDTISAPLFEAGELDPNAIKLFIVNDPSLNAFVAGGQNMFIHTGLILENDDPNLLIGVMAHETGHIIGGHLARKSNEAATAGTHSAIGYVLGIAAAALGSPEAAMALIGTGQQLAQSQFLKHSRAHEEAADDFALKLLKEVAISPYGLLTLLKTLGTDFALTFADTPIDPYRLTHPISSDRVSRIAASIQQDPQSHYPTPPKLKAQHQRISAKLRAFIQDPAYTIKHTVEKNDIPSRYMLTIAHYLALNLQTSLRLIDSLITDYPQDPYFHELKGQILFQNAQVLNAITSYKKALSLLPDSAIIKLDLAIAMLSTEDLHDIPHAITYLQSALLKEPKNPQILHQLGVAYGRQNQLGRSYLALAEEATLYQKEKEAREFIKLASKHIDLTQNSPTALKANDLMRLLKLTNKTNHSD